MRRDLIASPPTDAWARTTLADVQIHFASFVELAGDERRPLLVDARGEFLTEPGVREAYGKPLNERGPLALAMLIDSGYGCTFGNLALAFSTQRLPTRLFACGEHGAQAREQRIARILLTRPRFARLEICVCAAMCGAPQGLVDENPAAGHTDRWRRCCGLEHEPMITPPHIAPSVGPRRLVCAVPLLLAVVGACTFDASGIGSAGATSETGDNATTAPDLETTVVTTSTSSTDPTTTSGGTGTSMGATSTDPVTTDPVTTDPATTEPVTTDTTAMGTSTGSTAGPPLCGDGMLDAGEGCDDGNQVNDDACTNDCTPNICGDGMVGPGEGCDDGNASNNDACTNTCGLAACGDGFPQPGEACDDGNDVDGDGCTNACELGGTLVFVTAEVFGGNLGGLTGADKICQERAVGAGLTGTWMAWLSTDNPAAGPAQRFVQSTKAYRLVDGTIIADNWMDLTDGSLDAQIALTETGAAAGMTERVWTNTNTMGSFATSSDCSGWSPGNNGTYGLRTMVNGTWTNSDSSGCNDKHHLYCFQQ